MNKFKSILIKLSAGAALAFTGVVAINSTTPAQTADAATTLTTTKITVTAKKGTKIWTSYQNGTYTGKKATYGKQYKYIGLATDDKGRLWYAIGQNQWILAKYTVKGKLQKKTTKKTTKAVSQAPTGAEAAAKNWIAMRESGGSYSARNGRYIGKYQLDSAYLGGDYSAANQERVANNYVKSRYGSWVNAKNFWVRNGWY